jgi:cytochrome bd-type quinol oxidase subunit 2
VGAGVLFAVGAVSGTILSFEMGLLWPGLMGPFGDVIGLPFALEGFAFLIEAIFLGIWLYAWDRLPPRIHLLSGVPVVIAGVASAFFVVCANAWMNQPQGFDLVDGRVVGVRPFEAMFSPAAPPQTVHMIVATFMVAGFGIGRYVLVRVTAALAVAAVIWAWGLAQYPVVLPGMTVEEAAGNPGTLAVLLRVTAVGAIVLVPSLLLLFAVFQSERVPHRTPR